MGALNLYPGAEVAGEAIEIYRFVTISGGEVVLADAATDNVIGIAMHACTAGEKPVIAGPGSEFLVEIKAAETIGANIDVTADTGGKATATIANGNRRNARSTAAGSAAGGFLQVTVLDSSRQAVP